MHQASEHATTAARHRLPARPTLARPEAPLTPCSAPTGGTRSHLGERKRIVFTTLGSTLTLTPNPSLLPRARSIRAPPPTAYGAGQRCPAPLPLPRTQGSIAHANSAHTRRVSTQASKQAEAKGRRDTIVPPPQASAPTPRKRKHPKRTQPKRKHQTTREQTRPQASPNKARPQANTKSAHAKTRGQNSVSAGGPACPGRGDRHEAKQAKPPQGRARRQRTQKRANNGVCAEAVPPCARQTGGETRAKGRSQ